MAGSVLDSVIIDDAIAPTGTSGGAAALGEIAWAAAEGGNTLESDVDTESAGEGRGGLLDATIGVSVTRTSTGTGVVIGCVEVGGGAIATSTEIDPLAEGKAWDSSIGTAR